MSDKIQVRLSFEKDVARMLRVKAAELGISRSQFVSYLIKKIAVPVTPNPLEETSPTNKE